MSMPACVDVVLERTWDPPISDAAMRMLIATSGGCLDMHRVAWQSSMMSSDGHKLLCHFRAPDAESARIALRRAGADIAGLWAGTVHDAPCVSGDELRSANVAVSRCFDPPVEFSDVQALEDRASACLEMHRVRFLRSFFSKDRRRMVCLYRAPDAESVRLAQREAQMPVDRVWAFRRYGPETLKRETAQSVRHPG